MATTRLPSLWPVICRSCEGSNPALRSARAAQRMRAYHPSRRFQQEHIPQRYGTANEPPPHLSGAQGTGSTSNPQQQQPSQGAKELPKIGEKLQKDGEEVLKTDGQTPSPEAKKEPTTVDGQSTASPSPTAKLDSNLDSSEATPSRPPPESPIPPESKPMETILNSVPNSQKHTTEQQSSFSSHAEEHADKSFDEHSPSIKAPHMEAPRYVHHFDTYGLVKKLKEGGWDGERAITLMKAVRVILADQTDLAKEALVSKSQLENEAYLFKAACAELKTEVTTRRKSEQEKMRTERTQLQHEVDIISQRLGQETGGLKDELKGMFDDRTMAVRNEQRDMQSKIQQLNYQITVNLQSDAKTEVEGVRWVMTRRVILALGIVVMMVLGSLKAAANVTEERAREARKPHMTSGGTQTDENVRSVDAPGEVVVREGDNPGFVSLG